MNPLMNPKRLCFLFHHGHVPCRVLLQQLIQCHQLNFVSMITKKVRSNARAIFVLVHYKPEYEKFLERIKEGDRHVISVSGLRATVKVLDRYKFGLAGFDGRYEADRDLVHNAHFQYTANNAISPSSNLLLLLERMDERMDMRNIIRGIILKINYETGALNRYGNFILSGIISASSLSILRDIWPTTSNATVSAYILPLATACRIRNDNNRAMKVNRLWLESNVLQHFNEEVDSLRGRSSHSPNRAGTRSSASGDISQQVMDALRNLLGNGARRPDVRGRLGGRPQFKWNRRY